MQCQKHEIGCVGRRTGGDVKETHGGGVKR